MSGGRLRGWCGVVCLSVATVACEADQMAAPRLHVPADSAELFAADSSPDRAGLAALYHATAGPDWTLDTNWLTFDPLEDWYGVTADSLDRATRLVLPRNNLIGPLPPELGNLTRLETLDLEGGFWETNNLRGPMPPELGNLASLEYLNLAGTSLTGPIPPELGNLASLETLHLSYNYLTDPIPPELSNLASLETLNLHYNWDLTAIPPELGNLASLERLYLSSTRLTAIPPELGNLASLELLYLSNTRLTAIPPELGNLASLELLYLSNTRLTAIPPELGNLASLERLYLDNTHLTVIPPELGNLASLKTLYLANTRLTVIPPEIGNLASLELLSLSDDTSLTVIPPEIGKLARLEVLNLTNTRLTAIPPELGNLDRLRVLSLRNDTALTAIPPELGNLARLTYLYLGNTGLTAIPPELGNLARLEYLDLRNTSLTGPLPPGLGNLARLERLYLSHTPLAGPLPPELGNLARLENLDLSGNPGLIGVLPGSLTNLRRLRTFDAEGTGLCAPDDPAFLAWLRGLRSWRVSRCGDAVYLTQAVQSLDLPVPLVADEEALLRVFVTASANPDSVTLPPVVVRIYVNGMERHVEEIIPATPHPIPAHVDEGDLTASANAQVSGDLMRPGLELVIEIDPDSTLDPSLGVARRIPAEGRLAVDVREMPVFDLTIIPFLRTEYPDSSLVDLVEAMSANPQEHEKLRMTADLLPVREMRVTAHAPVETSSNSGYHVLSETRAIRAMEGGTGHWMGMLPSFSDVLGVARVGGKTSASVPNGSTIAHELGHNFNLLHAPCGEPGYIDFRFPDPSGRIGAWGYAVQEGQLVSYRAFDLMSYCAPEWISPYHFTKALEYRIWEGQTESRMAAAPVRSLLLWGGADSTGTPHLEPVFVVEAPPSLPDRGGPWTLAGRSADGADLFSLPFDMPEIADAGEGAGGFAFLLSTEPGWEALASVTLSGPGGTATLDASTDRPVSVWRHRDGQVRAILRGPLGEREPRAGVGRTDWSVLVSRGVPPPDHWQ